jgi:hypothetical protein
MVLTPAPRRRLAAIAALASLTLLGSGVPAGAQPSSPDNEVGVRVNEVWNCTDIGAAALCTTTKNNVTLRARPHNAYTPITTVGAGTTVWLHCWARGQGVNGDRIWYWVTEFPGIGTTPSDWPTGWAPGEYLNTGTDPNPSIGPCAGVDPGDVSDFSGDGYADVLGVDGSRHLQYYPHNGSTLTGPFQLAPAWDWGDFRHVKAADWSGDGYADVIGINTAGYLYYFAHNGAGLSAPQIIGGGWGAFRHLMVADWSGDLYADVLGVDGSGNLLYYPHNGNGLSAAQQIGTGWLDFRHVMAADFSGDGYADILGSDSAGNLWYYPHNGAGLSARQQIGSGFQNFRFVRAMDFSGDGAADVIGVDGSGNLWYYPHNGAGLGAAQLIGTGWSGMRNML